jgi:hypothetical protein
MATNAENMVTMLETFLASNVGVNTVTIDGQTVSYNRSQALTELKYWRDQVAKEGGTRKVIKTVNLSNCW